MKSIFIDVVHIKIHRIFQWKLSAKNEDDVGFAFTNAASIVNESSPQVQLNSLCRFDDISRYCSAILCRMTSRASYNKVIEFEFPSRQIRQRQ